MRDLFYKLKVLALIAIHSLAVIAQQIGTMCGLSRLLAREQGQAQERKQKQWIAKNPLLYEKLMVADFPVKIREDLISRLSKDNLPIKKHPQIDGNNLFFVCSTCNPDFIKMAVVLKRSSAEKLSLIALKLGENEKLIRTLFDEIILCSSHTEMAECLGRLQVGTILVKGGLPYTEALLCKAFTQAKVVLYAHALFMGFEDKHVDETSFELEKYALNAVDRLIITYDDQVQDYLREHILDAPNRAKRIEIIRPRCVRELSPQKILPKLSDQDGQHHLVYAQGVPPLGGQRNVPGKRRYEVWKKIVDQGIHLHVYSLNITKKPLCRGYEQYYWMDLTSPFFHLEEPLDYASMMDEFTRYDAVLFQGLQYPLKETFQNIGTNGFYTYVHAGIPMLCLHNSYRCFGQYAEKMGIGIDLKYQDVDHLKHLLDDKLHSFQSEDFLKARQDSEYEETKLKSLLTGVQ